MSCEQAFLGIDIGTSGTKVIAVDERGRVLAGAGAGYPLHVPRPGWTEQAPADWWRAVGGAVRDVVAGLPGGARQVAGIGLSGHMSSTVALDRRGTPLRPCITVADGRGGPEAEELTARLGPRLERLAGGQPGTSDIAPKLLWLKGHEPAVYERMASFVCAKDYVRFLLTGELATDPTDAGNTFLLDLRTRTWDVELCTDMGLDPAKLPPLVGTTDVVGVVTPEAAAATGLLAGTPVVAGGADMATSAVGTGVVRPGVVAVTIGTSAQVTTAIRSIPAGADGRVSFHPHAMPDLLYLMGSIFSGGLTLRWLARVLGEERALARLGSRYFDRLTAQAARSDAGSEGVLFLPFIVGSGTPDFDPAIRGAFVGLSLDTGRSQLVRAALEGVAYHARECLDVVRDLRLDVGRVHIGGGGSASVTWRRIMAGVLGLPLHPIRVREASALGAAALAAVGLHAFSDVAAASEAMVRYEEPVEPGPETDRYDRDFERYLHARIALRDLHRHWAATDAPGSEVRPAPAGDVEPGPGAGPGA